jgi:excisionase family DNA binding protein
LEVAVQTYANNLPTGEGSLPGPASPLGYSAAEVAALVGKHQNTIYEWLKAGVLRSRRIKGVHYISPATVHALFDDGALT